MGGPAQLRGQLGGRDLGEGVEAAVLSKRDRPCRELFPVFQAEGIGEVVPELMFVVQAENIVIKPFVVVTPFERQQEVVFLYELELLSGDLRILLVAGPDIVLRE